MEIPQTPPPTRIRFKSQQDWNGFIANLQANGGKISGVELQQFRLNCYSEIEKLRGRPLIVYASQFVNANLNLNGAPISIEIGDVDGFTDLINSISEGNSVDILIHSPGGYPDATERIVNLLRSRFKEVHFLIPHSAYSAATMLALSGDSIVLHPSATLGPIDPQINGAPARSIKKGFERVRDLIKSQGPEALPAYIPLIEKYSLHLLEMCDDSETLSKDLVSDWLKAYMLKTEKFENQIKDVVEYFSDYGFHRTHSRPLLYSKLEKFQLNISLSTDELSDLIWEAYILINGLFQISPLVKIYENTKGICWGKNWAPKNTPQVGPSPSRSEWQLIH